jgi:hypothetical protein
MSTIGPLILIALLAAFLGYVLIVARRRRRPRARPACRPTALTGAATAGTVGV